MPIVEILIGIVNISMFILPAVMLIDNLINGKYKILNICMLINIFTWVYLSYKWNIQNIGFWMKCDVRALTLIASALFIANIIAFIFQLKNKMFGKVLVFIASIFVYYIIMTNNTAYKERTRVDSVSEGTIREYVLEEHLPYLSFLGIELELFVNLLSNRNALNSRKS